MKPESDNRRRTTRKTLPGRTHQFNVMCPPFLEDDFEEARKKLGYTSKSEAIRHSMRQFIKEAELVQVKSSPN